MEFQSSPIEGLGLIPGIWFPDDRGAFREVLSVAAVAKVAGHQFDVAQINMSVSRRGVLRGMHGSNRPPGQAKFVTCVVGAVLDIVVDTRLESPTFGQWESFSLSESSGDAIHVAEGLAHGFMVLTDSASVLYATTSPYDPSSEFAVSALDPALALPWPQDISPILSDRDRAAPTLDDMLQSQPDVLRDQSRS
jgi:dTDP-4-dehydrorhamnose 3,5-epimerase